MPIFQQLFRSLPSWEETDDRWYSTPFQVYGDPSAAGRTVTKESALAMSAVYACITILSNSIASLPCYIYERQADDGRRRATERVADRILTRRPNGEMSPFRYKQVVMAHLAAWGNHYSYVERDERGIRNALWPLFPDFITVRRSEATGELEYVYRPPRGQERIFTPWEIFHVPGWGYNGIVGKSQITLAREAIGLGLAQEEFGARFYGSGTHPGLVVVHPGSPKPETMVNLRGAIKEQVGGLGKSHNLLMLQDNMKLENITINPVDAEFIVSRKLQLQEICRFYRMPPHMIADMDRATFSNIEHQGIEFVVHTLGPWLSLLEAEFSQFFLTPEERKYFYFEFNVNKFLRGDIKSRFAAYQIAKNAGWLNGDEVRSKENMNPMRDGLGKIYTVQAGVQSLDWLAGSTAPVEPIIGKPLAPTPANLMRGMLELANGMKELRERINNDTRGALKGGLDDLEERMTKIMSTHAVDFSSQLVKAASAINGAFARVMTFHGEERAKEAVALMVVIKKNKNIFRDAQKHNASEQQQVWEALKTLPGISDTVDMLRIAITDSSTALQEQVEEVKSSIMSTSGKLSKKVSRDLQELNDTTISARTRLDEGLTQLSESPIIEDAIGELRSVVTVAQGEMIEKLGRIHLDIDPIVAAFAKSREEVDIRFTAVEEAIRAGVTPKMLQGVVQEKFSEGLVGLLHRLDTVEGKLADIVPEDVVKSIVSGESQAVRDLIVEGQQVPLDLSPLESAIKDLGARIMESRQEPVDLSPLEGVVGDLNNRFKEIQNTDPLEPIDLSPLEDTIRNLGVQITENRPGPVDFSQLETAIKDLGARIAENRQEPIDLSTLEGAIKNLNNRFDRIPVPVIPEPVDLSPLEDVVKDISTQIAGSRQEPVDLSPLEGAVKDLGARIEDIQKLVKESSDRMPETQEPVNLEPVESAIGNLFTRFDEIREIVRESGGHVPEPIDLSSVRDAIKSLGTQIAEGRQGSVDLELVEGTFKDLGARIEEVRESVREIGKTKPEPVSLGPIEGAVKSLSSRLDEFQKLIRESSLGSPMGLSSLEGIVKNLSTQITENRQEPADMGPIEGAVKDLGARLGEVRELMNKQVPELPDFSPVEGALKDLSTQITEGRQEPVDLSPLEDAIKSLGTQITENRQEPVDVSQLEGAIKSLGAQLGEIHGLVRESGERVPSLPKPVDLSPMGDAIKGLSTQITEGRQEPADLSPLERAIKDLGAQIAEGRQEPIDLSPVESAIKDLGARLTDVRETVGDGVKLPDPVDLSPVERAIKDLGAQSGELHGAVSESASNQMTLVASIDKIVSAQTQMVEVLRELRSDSTDRGKEWAARSNELDDLVTGLQENIRNGLEELSVSVEKIRDSRGSHQDDHSKRIDKLEKRIATRVVASREKVNSQYLPLVRDTLQFILNRECIAVRRALKKFAGKREEMIRWLDDFYGAHPEFISLKLFRLFSSFLEALYTEVAIEGGMAGDEIPEGFDEFIGDHFDEYVARHMEVSYGYLKGVAGNEDQTSTADMIDIWHNERAVKVAIEELGRAGEAIVSFVESHGSEGS